MTDGPRAARLNELPKVVQLVNEVFLTGLGVPPVLGEFFPQLFNERNIENIRVIVEDGKPISHVGIWEGDLLIYGSWFNIGMIGCVCTHQNYRGRGYASALMKDASDKMRKDGVDIVFVTGFRNLYRRVGCVEAGRVHVYRIPSGRLHSEEKNLEITPYTPDKMKDLVEIYQREPVRYRRTLEEFKILVERGLRCPDILLKTFIASEAGRPLAYVSIGLVPDEKVVRVLEYAGSPRAVLHLVENVPRTLKIDLVELTVPFQDLELLNLLEKQGLERRPSEAHVIMAVINPESFLEKAGLYLEERIGEQSPLKVISTETGKLRLKIRKGEMELDSEASALLVFGAPDNLRNQNQPRIELNEALGLGKALPLPTPTCGLNYV